MRGCIILWAPAVTARPNHHLNPFKPQTFYLLHTFWSDLLTISIKTHPIMYLKLHHL